MFNDVIKTDEERARTRINPYEDTFDDRRPLRDWVAHAEERNNGDEDDGKGLAEGSEAWDAKVILGCCPRGEEELLEGLRASSRKKELRWMNLEASLFRQLFLAALDAFLAPFRGRAALTYWDKRERQRWGRWYVATKGQFKYNDLGSDCEGGWVTSGEIPPSPEAPDHVKAQKLNYYGVDWLSEQPPPPMAKKAM
mgnify:CR=1 FL=1